MRVLLHESQRFEFRNGLAECRFDTDLQRHMRARTTSHPCQSHTGRVFINGNQFDAAAVRPHEGRNPLQDDFDVCARESTGQRFSE